MRLAMKLFGRRISGNKLTNDAAQKFFPAIKACATGFVKCDTVV
jgi:hypothetical protein